jgi:hypothetical protein
MMMKIDLSVSRWRITDIPTHRKLMINVTIVRNLEFISNKLPPPRIIIIIINCKQKKLLDRVPLNLISSTHESGTLTDELNSASCWIINLHYLTTIFYIMYWQLKISTACARGTQVLWFLTEFPVNRSKDRSYSITTCINITNLYMCPSSVVSVFRMIRTT